MICKIRSCALICSDDWIISFNLSRYLVSELKFVDRTKVGVVGEGVGGYTAGMVMADDMESAQSITKCAILISPVVDWRSYGKFV